MYEIPQQLEYKEKIVFGLNFKQLAYAFGFFPIIFFLLFKFNASIQIRIFLAIYPAVLAVGFIFFNLEDYLKKWILWYRLRELTGIKLFDFLKIKMITEKLIHTDKNKIAVLKIEPINFDIKPSKEKETITLAFQKLLNSLDFPIQVLMTTENLNIESYLKSLKERVDEKSIEIFNEYKRHIKSVVKKDSISNRNFYIAIPEKTDIQNQINICEERLHGLNLRTKRLGNEGLRKLLIEVFGNKNEVYPKKIENTPYHLNLNNKLVRTIYAHGYPRIVETGFLDRIVSATGDFNLSLHIEPMLLETTMILLNKEIQKQRADLYAAKIKNQLNPSLEIKHKDTLRILENLQKGNEKLYNISLYITCKADNKKDLDLLTKKIESELNSLLIIPKKADFQMVQGLRSCLPLCEDSINKKRNITTKGLSAFFPFTSSFFRFDKTGVWFGLNKNKIPIIRDVFKLSNANGLCLATSGAGKSYLAKLFISRYLLNGTKVIVIDPQGEYSKLVNKFKGQRIDLSRKSETIINPLDLMGHSYPEKRLTLMDLMPIMLGELTEPQKSFMDRALNEIYERKNFYLNDPNSWGNKPPILEDLLDTLIKMEKRASSMEKITVRSLINRLNIYVNGVFSFLNQHTDIDFDNKFVCFDLGNLPKQIKPVMMFLVLDYVYTQMRDDLERKLLVVDEAWSLLSKTSEASYIFEIVKTCRKYNLGLLLLNQEVEDMIRSKAGRAVLANSSYTLLLKQKPAVIDDIQKVFHLSSTERIALLTALVGEGILIIEDEHSNIKVVASPREHDLITTNADELLKEGGAPKRVPIKKNYKDIKIEVDEEKRFFRKDEINSHEIQYLLKKGYKDAEFKSLVSNKVEKFLLKPRFNESLTHLFAVYDIAEYLEKKGIKTKKFVTRKPDIVFNIGKKKYAIEVETGAVLTKKERLLEKIKLLNKDYDKWFFVVTNPNKVKTYKKYGDSLDFRFLKTRLNVLRRQNAKSHSA
ncbi:MAG: DUF87 domain-containing protein [Nanoarchaeota archaeon]|nr:DUF87 domain-containing protein [Nanoarchaeota archaeon]MBU1028464.1 DUF87 domain-containing protein [Nanoarchaeota archaeon]